MQIYIYSQTGANTLTCYSWIATNWPIVKKDFWEKEIRMLFSKWYRIQNYSCQVNVYLVASYWQPLRKRPSIIRWTRQVFVQLSASFLSHLGIYLTRSTYHVVIAAGIEAVIVFPLSGYCCAECLLSDRTLMLILCGTIYPEAS